MEAKYLSFLKKEVQKTFGRKILTSTDCRYLYLDICQQQSKVSFNTLRRFFYLLNSKYKQSPYTLDVLSNYCGFESWSDFITYYKVNSSEDNSESIDVLQLIVSNFKNTAVKDKDDATFFSLVYQDISFMERHPHLLDQFQRKIANTINGQDFYYEQCINLDKLNSYFGSGIRYYMVAKKMIEAQIFGHYIIILKSWLTQNGNALKKHFEFLNNIEIQNCSDPHVIGYQLAMRIYYYNTFSTGLEITLQKARRIYNGFILNNENNNSIFRFLIHLVTALILCKQYEDALFYIEDINKNFKKLSLSHANTRLLELIPVYQALTYYHIKKEALALKMLEDIDPNKFHFLHKQFLTILYLSCKLHFRKISSDKKQYKSLVEQTGYLQLNTLNEN